MLSNALLICTIVMAQPAPKDTVPREGAIRNHLSQRYPVKNPRFSGERQFEPGTKVTELDTPVICRANSKLRLYRIKLSTGHFEFPQVEAAVAAWIENGVLKTAECFSPIYTGESPVFIAQLRGLGGKTLKDREQLASEICEVFKGITYRGRIVGGRLVNDEYRAELWHGKLQWRTVRVVFDAKGTISVVELIR